jgi:DNA-binding beta-propeller fold protein YncE
MGVAVDSAGRVYVADNWNHTIRKINPGGEVSTLAGAAGIAGTADGTGSSARFSFPCGIAVDGAGNLYVADTENHTIRKVTQSGQASTVAGLAGAPGNADGPATEARFNRPQSLTVDQRNGDLYVSDAGNHAVRKVDGEGHVTTLRGLAGSTPRFANPWGIVVDGAGNVFVAETDVHTVRRMSAIGIDITWAGEAGGAGYRNGDSVSARFRWPASLATDLAGNLYIADTRNQVLRKLDTQGQMTTLAGQAGEVGSADGVAQGASFNHLLVLAWMGLVTPTWPIGEITRFDGSVRGAL